MNRTCLRCDAPSENDLCLECEQTPATDEEMMNGAIELLEMLDGPRPDLHRPDEPGILIETLEEFAAVDEPGAEALLGEIGDSIMAANSDLMIYGDGGAGKTTLALDFACHAAAGDPWLGIEIPRPLNVLLIENEGPRPPLRLKMRRKLEAWAGSPLNGRVRVWSDPWTAFTFAEEGWRNVLADEIRRQDTDVVIIGPVTASGMLAAGTIQEVRAFHALVRDVAIRAERHVSFILVHHENRGGQVSGAWEGVGDGLLHVQAQGHGRTRVFIQKARWASTWHLKTLNLTWADGDSFSIEEKIELDDDTIAEQMLAAMATTPGISWTSVEKATPGVAKDRRRAIRDGLFAAGRILNVVKVDGIEVALKECPERKKASLFLADDPAVKHLRPTSGAVAAQSEPPSGADDLLTLRRAPLPIRGAGVGAADYAPADHTDEAAA